MHPAPMLSPRTLSVFDFFVSRNRLHVPWYHICVFEGEWSLLLDLRIHVQYVLPALSHTVSLCPVHTCQPCVLYTPLGCFWSATPLLPPY